jgi:hypothetical protein
MCVCAGLPYLSYHKTWLSLDHANCPKPLLLAYVTWKYDAKIIPKLTHRFLINLPLLVKYVINLPLFLDGQLCVNPLSITMILDMHP